MNTLGTKSTYSYMDVDNASASPENRQRQSVVDARNLSGTSGGHEKRTNLQTKRQYDQHKPCRADQEVQSTFLCLGGVFQLCKAIEKNIRLGAGERGGGTKGVIYV